MTAPRIGVRTWLLTLFVILTSVFGNFALGWGMKHSSEVLSPLGILKTVFTPWVLCGIGLLILWLLSRLTLLSRADLTFVLPVTALGYVLTALIGKFALEEVVTWRRWSGILLIVCGTVLVGMTSPKTGPRAGDDAS